MDISGIVAAQRAFFGAGNTRPMAFRLEALRKLQTAVREQEGAIAEALRKDLNKPPFESYLTETGLVLEEISFHLRHLKSWAGERRVRTPLTHFPARSFIAPEPFGVALIMAPWNYPLQLCLLPLIGAISAGNCAVLKPSAYAPAVSRLLADLLGGLFPKEYIAVVEGGRAENQALLAQHFDFIFFTGSANVGRVVMRAAAEHLTPLALELGGKSPVILDRTARLEQAARRIAFGKVLNAGQTCVAPDYLLLESGLEEAFTAAFQKALAEFFPEGGMKERMARIITDKHYQEKKALLQGVRPAVGGGFDDALRFIEPTLVLHADPDSPLMREEIFAPILPVISWKTLDEAIAFVNAREKPLALYHFTRDRAARRAVLSACSFGGGCVNDTIMQAASSHLGFGGVGESGLGRYHGKLSFDIFTNPRGVVDRATGMDLKVRYRPYTRAKFNLLRRLLK